jgi:5-methylcytosine-specific restriction endonuclease McrA
MLAIGNEKHCPSCNETKHIKNFGPSKQKKDGLKVYCYDCCKIKSKKYYYKDIEKSRNSARDRVRRYRKRHPEIAEKERLLVKEWYYNNRQHAIDRRREWRQTPSGRWSVAKMIHKRNSRMKNSIVDLSFDDIEFLLLLQNNECAKCENEFTDNKKYTLDHIIPLSMGGDLILENVQLLCRSCNSSKSNTIAMYRPNINFRCLNFI